MRVGAIDCGTNSIRLLIADIDALTGDVRDVVRRMEVVRLGHGVDRTGRLDPERIAATIAMAQEYSAQCRDHGVEAVRFVATSASRDASNAAEFVAGVQAAFADFGIRPEVVTGEEEAGLSFRGATGDLQAHGILGPYLVVDIGGGSTEFVVGTHGVTACTSTDVGCVRLTERHLASDPPTAEEVAAARADAEAAMDGVLDKFLKDGVAPADFARIKTQIRASEIYARDDAMGLAQQYGQALAVGLSVEDVKAWPDVLQAVTEADVMAAANAVLNRNNAVTGWLTRKEEAAK